MREVLADGIELWRGDCLAVLPLLPAGSFDSCVTDPPYHLTSIVKRFGRSQMEGGEQQPPNRGEQYKRLSKGFMGKQWDGGDIAFRPEVWELVLALLKPGAHLVAFGGTRTYHRMACAIEDAGFEVRDTLCWMYGSGFPKSHDVSKGIVRITAPATDAARQWNGFGTALKPACELIVLARKPLSERTVAANVLKHGVGALNIDGCRINANIQSSKRSEDEEGCPVHGLRGLRQANARLAVQGKEGQVANKLRSDLQSELDEGGEKSELHGRGLFRESNRLSSIESGQADEGRQAIAAKSNTERLLGAPYGDGEASGARIRAEGKRPPRQWQQTGQSDREPSPDRLDRAWTRAHENRANYDGAVERKSEITGCTCRGEAPLGRWPANVVHDGSDEVLASFPEAPGQQYYVGPEHGDRPSRGIYGDFGARPPTEPRFDSGSAARFFYTAKADADDRLGSKHPTVKPLDLIQWLVRMITPKGGHVLDLFAGTGTTGEAAFREGCKTTLIEREPEYQADIVRRVGLFMAGPEERYREGLKASGRAEGHEDLPLFKL